MAEKPILFSGEMVRALLEGRKTQTRRVMNPQPSSEFSPIAVEWYEPVVVDRNGEEIPGSAIYGVYDVEEGYRCPYGAPGDRLWVRETWRAEELEDGTDGIRYAADNAFLPIENNQQAANRWVDVYNQNKPMAWKPSIFLPRWASRINLEIMNVRVERIKQITDADAGAEGCNGYSDAEVYVKFQDLWDKINGPRGFGWDVNPWVWVVEFKVV